LIVGTSHDRYQVRPQCGPEDGANEFRKYILEMARVHTAQTIAEEMSVEALRGRTSVGGEVANEENLDHILCDPTCAERQALGISKHNTRTDNAKREKEWLRRLVRSCRYPVLFLCGATHVASFARRCQDAGLVPNIVNPDFEVEIPLHRRII
jgi:hypothetical protein